MAGDAAHRMVQQDVGRAGRTWPAVGADHTVRSEGHLYFIGFEPLVQKLSRALSEDLHQRHQVLRPQATHSAGEFEIIQKIQRPARRKRGRRCQQQIFDHARDPLELVFVGRVNLGVVA